MWNTETENNRSLRLQFVTSFHFYKCRSQIATLNNNQTFLLYICKLTLHIRQIAYFCTKYMIMKTIVEKSFKTTSNTDMLSLIETVRKGINFKSFLSVPGNNNFNLHEWSNILHLSERTMQRYKKESIPFEPLQSEKILQIALIFQKGKEVFGDEKKFSQWLSAENLSLGGSKPKELLDNVFGIQMIENELIKIEYGILA